MSGGTLRVRCLRRAQQRIGGPAALCRYLRVDVGRLVSWMRGEEEVPEVVFFRVIDFLLDDMSTVQTRAVTAARRYGLATLPPLDPD